MQGIPNETALAIHITDKCNLKCPGCYTLDKLRNTVINYDYIKLALDKYKPKDIVFFGGEAILEPDILRKTMKEYPDIRYSLHTNGSNFNKFNKDIYDKLYKIILSLDSFNPEWLKKYKCYTDKDIVSYQNLINTYQDKISVTHNVFASHNDPNYVKDMEKYNFVTDWYVFITKARDQEFLQYFREYMSEFNRNINTMPKLRLLTNGTITRDMRGVYNLFHVNGWNDEKLKEPLPVSDKCRKCKYSKCCQAFIMFPHFVKDILDTVNYEPHFCKFTKIFWRYRYG